MTPRSPTCEAILQTVQGMGGTDARMLYQNESGLVAVRFNLDGVYETRWGISHGDLLKRLERYAEKVK